VTAPDGLARLLELEQGFWRAAGNRQAYERHLAPDALHVLPGLGLAERDQALHGVEQADPWSSFEIVEPRVVALGDSAAALCYRAEARRGADAPYEAAIISVYRLEAGEWRLAVHQQTPLGR
jgi:hypothetical protein